MMKKFTDEIFWNDKNFDEFGMNTEILPAAMLGFVAGGGKNVATICHGLFALNKIALDDSEIFNVVGDDVVLFSM